MADDITGGGGTQNEQTPETFSKAQVEELLAKAKEEGTKEGQAVAHKHFQSVADQQIDKVNKLAEEKLAGMTKELGEFRTERLKTMSPEDRSTAMLEEVYARLTKPEENASSTGKTSESTDNGQADFGRTSQDARQAARDNISPILKELGVDTEKVDWADDIEGPESMKRFLASIVAQSKPEEKKEQTEEEKEAERFSTSKSLGSSGFDILKANPLDLISEGLKESRPSRQLG